MYSVLFRSLSTGIQSNRRVFAYECFGGLIDCQLYSRTLLHAALETITKFGIGEFMVIVTISISVIEMTHFTYSKLSYVTHISEDILPNLLTPDL